MTADPESCALLRAVVRGPGAVPGRLDELADKLRNWDSLLSLAEEHRLFPQLFLRLEEMGPAVPAAVRQRVRAEYQRNIFHSLANAAELLAILKVFDAEAIPAMPFKGVVLAASVYGDITRRFAGDLDLLIHRRDLLRATELLLKRGYELQTEVHADGSPAASDYYEYHFERRSDGMVAELRWRLELIQPRFTRDLGMDWVWPHRRTSKLAGADVPDMSPGIALLLLCMHGSKHVWSRLLWICDVAQLLASHPDLNWEEVKREARRTGLSRTLALGGLLAHRIAGAEVPPAVLRRFQSDRSANRLARHIEEHVFDAPGSTPPGPTPYSIELLSFPDRLRLLLSVDLLRPNERDRAVLKLPKALHGLYYLVRPIRILFDRSPR